MKLVVFTSRYSNKGIANTQLRPIGITAFLPKFPLAFHVAAHLRELAPSPGMLSQVRAGTITEKQFRVRYLARLDVLGADRVREMLTTAQGKAAGVALLCFEDVHAGERCHRRYLADWLRVHLGLTVEELPEDSRWRASLLPT